MDYYEVTISSETPYAYDILTAYLAEIGFESFENDEISLKAYIQEDLFDAELLRQTCHHYQSLFPFQYSTQKVQNQNWNAIWESGFQAIEIDNRLRIRAVFHEPDPSFPLEIVIQPKMSFGTGHHATTKLVIEFMLDQDFNNKKIFDFGTGTGILAILAQKRGAASVFAADNDKQCIENASENFTTNQTETIQLFLGSIRDFEEDKFDIILANITRNTILENFDVINLKLQPCGLLIASGFYEEDLTVLNEKAAANNFVLKNWKTIDKWCAAVYQKDMTK